MVIACLTTIPPRINDECRLTIDSLLHQVDRIFLCVSHEYQRFGKMETIPSYLLEEPYCYKVKVIIHPDYGSASKYIGALEEIVNLDEWIFICDDDQEYHPELISKMSKAAVGKNCVYQNRYEIFSRYGTHGGYIHGFVGLFIHSTMMAGLREFPLPYCARYVDDQWFSLYCFFNNLLIQPTGIFEYHDIYKVLQNSFEKVGKESLFFLFQTEDYIRDLCAFFKVQISSINIHKL